MDIYSDYNETGNGTREKKLPFEQVYEKYFFEIFRYINRHLNNHHESEDLTSEVFVYCYQHYEHYDPNKSAINTWLYIIAKSRLKTYYRDRKQHLDLSDFEEWLLADEQDMNRAVYLDQLRDYMAKIIALLPEKQQKVLVMRYFQRKEYSEIADVLETTPGNVRVILSRALDRMKQYIGEENMDWRL